MAEDQTPISSQCAQTRPVSDSSALFAQKRLHRMAANIACCVVHWPTRYTLVRVDSWCWMGLSLALLLALTLPRLALAHPQLVRTEPSAGTRLVTAPEQVRIVFNEPLEAAFSIVHVLDVQGRPVDQGDGGRLATEPTILAVTLPALEPGIYTVIWRTVGSDGHPVRGYFAFAIVGTGAPTTPIPATPLPAMPVPSNAPPPADVPVSAIDPPLALSALLRALMLLGTTLGVGSWAVGALLFRSALHPYPVATWQAAYRRWRLGVGVGLLILLTTIPTMLVVYTMSIAGSADGAHLWNALLATRYGQALLARMLATSALVVVLLSARGPGAAHSWRDVLALLFGAGLLLSFALSSHAAAAPAPTLPVLAAIVHLAATTVWGGGLALLMLALPPVLATLDQARRITLLADLITRFSRLALLSVAALTASGVYAVLLHLTALPDLWQSNYGRALLGKLALFSGLLGFGAYHLLLVRPRFNAWVTQTAAAVVTARWQRRFLRALRGEMLLVAGVFLVVGVLTSLPPPEQVSPPVDASTPEVTGGVTAPAAPYPLLATPPAGAAPLPAGVFTQTQPADDLRLILEATPACAGPNRLIVGVTDAAGKPVETQLVRLTLATVALDLGVTSHAAQLQADGRYLVPEGWLSLVGEWQVRVLVRRAGLDDVEAVFVVPVEGC